MGSIESKSRLKNCTINIPDLHDEIIQKLIKLRIVPSRSEAIRTAIREFLAREEQIMIFFNTIMDTQEENISSWSKTTSTIKTTQRRKEKKNGE